VDLATGEMRQITPKEGKGSVADAAFAPDGKSVYLATDRYGDFNSVWRIDLERLGQPPASTAFGKGQKWDVEKFAISPDGRTLAASVNEDGWSRIYLAGKGGVSVPAFLLKPRSGGRVPVVILWHGGPEGQSRPTFDPALQFLVNEMGFAALAPNVRGSTGYGKKYVAMDNGPLREEALTD